MPKTIVITGCSSGLGRATMLHFAALGWRVWATVRKEADLSQVLVEAMSKGWGDRLTPVLCDITQPEDVARLARVVADATPTLDALGRRDSWESVRAVVAGFGVSGFAAADTLTHLGARVRALDEGADEDREERAELLAWVSFTQQRSLETLGAEAALRRLAAAFPDVAA